MADRPYVNQLNFSAPEPPPARLAWTVKDELRVKKLGPRKPDPKATGMSTEQLRRNRGRPRNQCPRDPVVMDQVMGIRSSQKHDFDEQHSNARAKATKLSAGKAVAPKTLDEATGLARTKGTRMYGRTRGELPVEPDADSAGVKTVTLSDHRGAPVITAQPDTTTSKKKLAPYAAGAHAQTVNAVIRSPVAVPNNMSDSAGAPSRVGTEAGPQLKKAPLRLEGEVEKLVFGDKPHPTDDDPRRRHFDDRDFRDAAGTRTGLGTKDSTAGSMEAPLTFEQIPHSKFVPYRRKANVPTTGSMGEEIMYNREVDHSDYLDTSVPMYLGAAGETTQKSALRYEREQLNGNKAVRPGNSVIDSLVFMHDMDNSEADDAYVERLYEGCFGNRASGPNVHHPYDVSTRRRDHLTGDKIYGFNSVHGTDLDGDAEVVDPRDFDGCAGLSTKLLAERHLGALDVTMRTATFGSNLVHPTEVCIRPNPNPSPGPDPDLDPKLNPNPNPNPNLNPNPYSSRTTTVAHSATPTRAPRDARTRSDAVHSSMTRTRTRTRARARALTQVDEVIFGQNLDKSGTDPRDFAGAAGHGGRTHHGVSGAVVKG